MTEKVKKRLYELAGINSCMSDIYNECDSKKLAILIKAMWAIIDENRAEFMFSVLGLDIIVSTKDDKMKIVPYRKTKYKTRIEALIAAFEYIINIPTAESATDNENNE